MRKSIIILFLFAAVVSMNAQKAEDIVKQAMKARGDISLIKKNPCTTEMTMTIPMPAMGQDSNAAPQKLVMTMKFTVASEKKIRVDASSPMASVSMAINGKTGWMSQNGLVQDIPEEQLDMMISQYSGSGFGGDYELFDYKNKGKELSIIGSEILENGDCWIIGVAEKGKQPIKFWINKETLLTEKMTARSAMLGQEMEMEIMLGDYKKFDGILMPSAMAINVMGSVADVRITNFKFLDKVDESLFVRPVSKTPVPETEKK